MDIKSLYQIFQRCTCVTTDSRNCPQGSLFVALKGATFNGNAFAANALEQGCAYAVVDEAAYVPAGDARYVRVDNSLRALQLLANYHRRELGTRIIGITGTNGKTTTKELIAAVLSQKYRVLYTQGNFNNQIGVPLTLLRLTAEHDLAVIEMGASHPGDIKELVEIVEPNYGLITNVGNAHLEGFGSFEGVIKTKGELFDYLRTRKDATIFIDPNNPYLMRMVDAPLNPPKGTAPLNPPKGGTYSSQVVYYPVGYLTTHHSATKGNEEGNPFLAFEWRADDADTLHSVQTQLIGEYNLTNALAAIAVGCHFSVPPCMIDKALGEYTPQNNRSQLKQTADNRLIIDAYNANPASMNSSISSFCHMNVQQKMLILGDMLELGEASAAEHQKIVDFLEQHGFEEVILVGEQFAATRHSHSYRTYPNASALIEALKQQKPTGKTILIKGSNGMKLSSVVEFL